MPQPARAPRMRAVAAVPRVVLAALLAAAAVPALPDGLLAAAAVPALPDGLHAAPDLRGAFRQAYCARLAAGGADCTATLRRYAGEGEAPRPAPAEAARYRLVFVPGFLARCFPGVHTFDDMMQAARAEGFAVSLVEVGSRSGIAANARQIAAAIDALPDDGRTLVLVGHSKGPVDILEMLAQRPDIARRTRAVLSIAGALLGSPLADDLRGVYAATLKSFPFGRCERGDGDPMADLAPAARRAWWDAHAVVPTAAEIARPGARADARAGPAVPVYALSGLPELATLSPLLLATHARLAQLRGANDGMVALRDQLPDGVALLGVVDADHFRIAIPFPGFAYLFLVNAEPFPRAAMLLAALDVIDAHER